jgi:hypothetical protein
LLKTIAVDITLVLAGSENGGARLFVENLLVRLADSHLRCNSFF